MKQTDSCIKKGAGNAIKQNKKQHWSDIQRTFHFWISSGVCLELLRLNFKAQGKMFTSLLYWRTNPSLTQTPALDLPHGTGWNTQNYIQTCIPAWFITLLLVQRPQHFGCTGVGKGLKQEHPGEDGRLLPDLRLLSGQREVPGAAKFPT